MSMLFRFFSVTALLLSANIASAQNSDEPAGTFVRPAPTMSLEEKKWHIGALAGANNTSDGNDSNLEYGLDVGFQPYIPFGAGVELSKTDTGDLSRVKLLARGTYNFGGTIPFVRHSYVGIVAGAVNDSNTDNDGTWLASGPVAGFDIPIREFGQRAMSLGAQAQYVAVEGSSPDSFLVNGAMKFWY